jgi:hypothetical protein
MLHISQQNQFGGYLHSLCRDPETRGYPAAVVEAKDVFQVVAERSIFDIFIRRQFNSILFKI